jgi:hypothetical protein
MIALMSRVDTARKGISNLSHVFDSLVLSMIEPSDTTSFGQEIGYDSQ